MSCGLRSLRPFDRVIERSHDSQVTALSPELIKRTVLRIVQKRREITLDKLFTYSTKARPRSRHYVGSVRPERGRSCRVGRKAKVNSLGVQ